MLLPLVRCKAAAATVVVRPAEEEKSCDDAVVKRIDYVGSETSHTVVVHKTAVAV
jgi:hypothetical protein